MDNSTCPSIIDSFRLDLTGALWPLVIMQPARFALRPPATRAVGDSSLAARGLVLIWPAPQSSGHQNWFFLSGSRSSIDRYPRLSRFPEHMQVSDLGARKGI